MLYMTTHLLCLLYREILQTFNTSQAQHNTPRPTAQPWDLCTVNTHPTPVTRRAPNHSLRTACFGLPKLPTCSSLPTRRGHSTRSGAQTPTQPYQTHTCAPQALMELGIHLYQQVPRSRDFNTNTSMAMLSTSGAIR